MVPNHETSDPQTGLLMGLVMTALQVVWRKFSGESSKEMRQNPNACKKCDQYSMETIPGPYNTIGIAAYYLVSSVLLQAFILGLERTLRSKQEVATLLVTTGLATPHLDSWLYRLASPIVGIIHSVQLVQTIPRAQPKLFKSQYSVSR